MGMLHNNCNLVLVRTCSGSWLRKELTYTANTQQLLIPDKSRTQGSDPRAATCRGKLQSKRSKLNMEINKELMLRSGAENLFK